MIKIKILIYSVFVGGRVQALIMWQIWSNSKNYPSEWPQTCQKIKKIKKIKISKNHQKSWFWAKWRSPWAPGRKIDVEWIQNFWFSSHGDPFHAYFCVFFNFSLLKQITQVAYSLNEEFLEKLSCYLAICGSQREWGFSLQSQWRISRGPVTYLLFFGNVRTPYSKTLFGE